MSVALQWAGAILALIAFGLSQLRVWPVSSYRYLGFNLIGGTLLSVAAGLAHQWGFVLLEGVWGLVAGWSMTVRLRRRELAEPQA